MRHSRFIRSECNWKKAPWFLIIYKRIWSQQYFKNKRIPNNKRSFIQTFHFSSTDNKTHFTSVPTAEWYAISLYLPGSLSTIITLLIPGKMQREKIKIVTIHFFGWIRSRFFCQKIKEHVFPCRRRRFLQKKIRNTTHLAMSSLSKSF